MIGMIESELENHIDVLNDIDDELVIKMMNAEIRRFKNFIKKWKGAGLMNIDDFCESEEEEE